jgi:ankyrin repeat protein
MFAWFIREYGADINAVNQAGETPLIIAAREGKLDILRLIVENFKDIQGFNVDQKMNDGWTALSYAAMNGFCSAVELLAKNGADVNATDRNLRSPFHWAARFNNIKVATLLLKLGCKHGTTDREMQTPAQIAKLYGNREL